MHERWSDFTTELESGKSDRVNQVIDEVNDMSLDERVELFNVCFDELARMYEEVDDGYVRQSLVRVADQLIPGLPTVIGLDNDDRSIGIDETELQDQTDALCGFLLEALTDDDGRVRQAAKSGLKDVFRTYDALNDEETLEALVVQLDEMAGETSGTQAKHLREAKEEAKSSLQSGIARLVEGFQEEFDDSLQ